MAMTNCLGTGRIFLACGLFFFFLLMLRLIVGHSKMTTPYFSISLSSTHFQILPRSLNHSCIHCEAETKFETKRFLPKFSKTHNTFLKCRGFFFLNEHTCWEIFFFGLKCCDSFSNSVDFKADS